MFKKFACIALIFTTCACGGNYDYKPRTTQEVPAQATFNLEDTFGSDGISKASLVSINGASVSAHYLFLTFDSSQILAGNRVPFTPGAVTLSYEVQSEAVSEQQVSFTFEAKPGESYAPRILAANAPLIELVNSRGFVVSASAMLVP